MIPKELQAPSDNQRFTRFHVTIRQAGNMKRPFQGVKLEFSELYLTLDFLMNLNGIISF